MKTAYFNRFSLDLPDDAINDCSHAGDCASDVGFWASSITRTPDITPQALSAELWEYGAWEAEELSDDAANWRRIIWIAAGNIREEEYQQSKAQ